MTIDVSKLPAPGVAVTVTPRIDVGTLVAGPNVAPAAWQTAMAAPAGGWKPPVKPSSELDRVVALPRRPVPVEGTPTFDLMRTMVYSAVGHRGPRACRCREIQLDFGIPEERIKPCIRDLKAEQVHALYEIMSVGGALGQIGVGIGKTTINILAPLAFRGCRKALLLLQPGDVRQHALTYEMLAEHFAVPSIIFETRDAKPYAVRPGMPALHIYPYSLLSRPESSGFLRHIQPDVIIADECDKLRDRRSATSIRYLRYYTEFPDTRGAVHTGTLTDASIRDYAHLAAVVLRYGSPLPVDPEVVDDWARAIDPSPLPAPMGALVALCEPGEGVRQGFHRRLRDTPGVIMTTSPAVSVEMTIEERKPSAIPQVIQDALRQVRDYVRPDGEELIEAIEMQRCAREVACGFFYYWHFPPVNGRPQRVEDIERWRAARKAWRKAMRKKLEEPEEHLDSPKLLENAAKRAWGELASKPGMPEWKCDAWPEWRDVEKTVVHVTRAQRLHPYLAEDAAAWAREHRGVVWYEAAEFGKWVSELSQLTLHTGGPKAPELLMREDGRASIVCSIKSHGRGRDGLQRLFDEQLVANPPANATGWEQLLGRLARTGQESDHIHTWFYRHTPELKKFVDKALRRAEYVRATMGTSQKLLDGISDEVYDDMELEGEI